MTAPSHKRILLIEDDLDASEAFRLLLQSDGHFVTVAYTGEEGLLLARSCQPDVVICDLGLPDMDGFEVASAMRRILPVRPYLVAVSGYGGAEDRARSSAAGYHDHFTKPIDVAGVLAHLAALPTRTNSLQEHNEASGPA